MADSLFLPLAAKVPNDHSSLIFRNCPFPSRLLPSNSFSLQLNESKNKLNELALSQYSLLPLPHRLGPIRALDSDVPRPFHKGSVNFKSTKSYEEWDSLTAKFAGASNIPFLLLQLPQIILNACNLLAGNKTALLAVPWLGMFTGLLGNLSLLSYFAKKKEKEAVVVQTLGVVSIYVVITQLAMAEAMPLPHFVATSVVIGAGLILNFLNYYGMLNATIWQFWEDFTTVGGLSVLPQIMWSTFVPYIPNSILPGAIAFVLAVVAVTMAHMGKLSEEGVKFVGAISGWTATLLFMWMPVSQVWTNFLNPDNIKGLSAFSMLLAMIGNGLMIPRALFIRDFMCFNCISRDFFFAATVGLISWLGMALWRDSVVHEYDSPIRSLKELVFGS
ncbi:maltose excess protein 1, chloroplastic-like isoform X2 [Durio zibethinus]|uniref:Maltose excess protein 1, chloroplastic-like isoform X2 n=1 Tax=Durio zibethinus TaxID=66656 RepID=A0A6P5WUZ9_DURZI|nr:maltose excess protein 1, chloroplastic-like isoform X2 [Durio zibethinus]